MLDAYPVAPENSSKLVKGALFAKEVVPSTRRFYIEGIPKKVVMEIESDYRSLLDRAYSKLPEQVEAYERWVVPRPDVRTVGRRTVIMNFKEIADELRRDPSHLLKFLSGEMATLANFDGTRAVFKGRFRADSIRNLLEVYTNKYVVCPVCNRPDTRIVREKRLWFLQCEACGARSSIGTK